MMGTDTNRLSFPPFQKVLRMATEYNLLPSLSSADRFVIAAQRRELEYYMRPLPPKSHSSTRGSPLTQIIEKTEKLLSALGVTSTRLCFNGRKKCIDVSTAWTCVLFVLKR
jgi:hypothetical protein